MCDTVYADALLAIVLQKRPQVSFCEIRRLRDKIERHHPDVIVDISAPSIGQALAYYRHVFVQHGNTITRAPQSAKFFRRRYVKDEFLSRIPQAVCSTLKEVRASR